jgi:antirestriction protein ArdC
MNHTRLMYEVRQDKFEYVRDVEKILNRATENMRHGDDRTFLCLCRD